MYVDLLPPGHAWVYISIYTKKTSNWKLSPPDASFDGVGCTPATGNTIRA